MNLIRSLAYRVREHPRTTRLALALIPDLPWTLQLPSIGRFRFRLRRHRSFWLRPALDHEQVPFAMLRTLVRPGDVVFDVGANIGLYTRYLLNVLHAGQVVAFEPIADNRSLLEENIALGGTTERVTVVPFALSDHNGAAEFQVDDKQSTSGALSEVTGGQASVGRQNLGLAPMTATVECRRLDSLVGDGLPEPDFLKIDVEGAEALVLRGARKLLTTRRPRMFIEMHGAEVAWEVLTFLHALGYACAGKVSSRLDASGFARLDPVRTPRARDLYDVHFLVASPRAEELPTQLDGARTN